MKRRRHQSYENCCHPSTVPAQANKCNNDIHAITLLSSGHNINGSLNEFLNHLSNKRISKKLPETYVRTCESFFFFFSSRFTLTHYFCKILKLHVARNTRVLKYVATAERTSESESRSTHGDMPSKRNYNKGPCTNDVSTQGGRGG